jgi:transcription initiation factor IIE alpha subunit
MTMPDALNALAASAPSGAPARAHETGSYGHFDVEAWLERFSLGIKSKDAYEGGLRFILEECPFNPEHKGTSAAAFQSADSMPGFKCQHEGCAGKGWVQLRELKEPGYKDRRNGHRDYAEIPKSETPSYQTAGLKEVIDCAQKWLYLPDTGGLEIALGTVAANRLPGDPVWTLIISPPGWGKTELVNSLTKVPEIHPVAVLTEASLLSGTPRKESTGKGGLLRDIGDYGILLIKDFGGILSLSRETRGPILAAMREIYDGAWTRIVGSEGGRTLTWAGKAGLIGGATPAIDGHYAVMALLGERFSYYRMPETEETKKADKALLHAGEESQMRLELSTLVAGLFTHLEIPSTLPVISDTERQKLVALAVFTTRCRSAVDRDSYQSREIQLIPGVESPTRLVKVLMQLLRGLLVVGVARDRAWELVTKTALDSMPSLRQNVVAAMLKASSSVTTPRVAEELGYPTNTTRRTLEDLAAYGVVSREPGGSGRADVWTLTDWTVNIHKTAMTDLTRNTKESVLNPINQIENMESSISGAVQERLFEKNCPVCDGTVFYLRTDRVTYYCHNCGTDCEEPTK